jgi:hypothetical protein
VITGYGPEAEPAVPGYPVTAFIALETGQSGDRIVSVRTVLSPVRFL